MQGDYSDLQNVMEWFETSNPFDVVNRKHLQSLSSGLVADETINCDHVENVGHELQSKLDCIAVTKATIKRKEKVKPLAALKNIVRIQNQTANIDPTQLFTRLIVLAERYDDIKSYFEYELTAIPTSLFTDNFMRKPNKASLIQSLSGKEFQLIDESEIISSKYNVVDGEALLRKPFLPPETKKLKMKLAN